MSTVSYQVQKEQNESKTMTYEEVQEALQAIGGRFAASDNMELLVEIVENTLGAGKKVSECTKKQMDAMMIILDDLHEKADELGI